MHHLIWESEPRFFLLRMIRFLPRRKLGLSSLALGLAALLPLAFVTRCVVGHESRTIGRLIRSGLVAHEKDVRLLHSTGYLRENTHIFQVSKLAQELSPEAMPFSDDLALKMAREHLQKHLNSTVDWSQAEFYVFAAGKDDDWILWSAVVIKFPNTPLWVVFSVF